MGSTTEEKSVTGFTCSGRCLTDAEHDWTGPGYERTTPEGGHEAGATCAKCGMEFGHFALWTFD